MSITTRSEIEENKGFDQTTFTLNRSLWILQFPNGVTSRSPLSVLVYDHNIYHSLKEPYEVLSLRISLLDRPQ